MAPSDRTDGPCDRTAALSVPKSHPASLTCSIRSLSVLSVYTRRVVLVQSKGHVPRTWLFITKPLALTRVGYADGSNRTMDWAVGINGWTCPKRHELPKVTSYQRL